MTDCKASQTETRTDGSECVYGERASADSQDRETLRCHLIWRKRQQATQTEDHNAHSAVYKFQGNATTEREHEREQRSQCALLHPCASEAASQNTQSSTSRRKKATSAQGQRARGNLSTDKFQENTSSEREHRSQSATFHEKV